MKMKSEKKVKRHMASPPPYCISPRCRLLEASGSQDHFAKQNEKASGSSRTSLSNNFCPMLAKRRMSCHGGPGGIRASDHGAPSLNCLVVHSLDSQIQNPRSKIQNPESKIQNPESKIQNSPIQNPKSKLFGRILGILDFGFWNLDFGSLSTNSFCEAPGGPILDFGFRILNFGFWISDFGFRILDFGFRISDFGFWISDFGFWISDFGFRISDFGFWILDFGFWILDFGFWILGHYVAILFVQILDFGFRILDFGFWILFWTLHKIRILVTPTRVGGFRVVHAACLDP